MATNPINLVDAVSTVMRRTARNRSGVLRVGVVRAVSGEWCSVEVASKPAPDPAAATITAGYSTHYSPTVGDVVSLLNDGDRWLVLGRQAAANKASELSIQCGTEKGVAFPSSSFSVTFTFPRAFTAPPVVVANIGASSGGALSFQIRAVNVTATAATLVINSPSGGTYAGTGDMSWIATGYYTQPPSMRETDAESGHHYATLTCHTSGCVKDNVPVPLVILLDEGSLPPRCGACSQNIVDIT